MRKVLSALTVLAMLVPFGPAMAQDAVPSRSVWFVSSTVRVGEVPKVTCTLAFPTQASAPKLRAVMTGRDQGEGVVTFSARGVGKLADGKRAPLTDITLAIGSLTQSALKGSWSSSARGTLTFKAQGASADLLTALGKAKSLVITTAGKTYTYDLTGSGAAAAEAKTCIS